MKKMIHSLNFWLLAAANLAIAPKIALPDLGAAASGSPVSRTRTPMLLLLYRKRGWNWAWLEQLDYDDFW